MEENEIPDIRSSSLQSCDLAIENSALHHAVYRDDIEMVNALLREEDTNVDCQNKHKDTPLTWGIINGCSLPVIMSLLNAGCDVNITNNLNCTALHLSMASRNNVNVAHELIKRGADLNIPGGNLNDTPLFYAIDSNNIEALCMLLYYGADVSLKNVHNCTPFMRALSRSQTAIASILLDYYDDFNCVNIYGNTPLLLVAPDASKLAMQIIDAGADVNCINDEGEYALQLAIDSENYDLFRKIWCKLDLSILLQIEEPLFLTYMDFDDTVTDEWVECFLLMLESPIAFDLMQHYNQYIFRYRYLPDFFTPLLKICKKISFDARMGLISICLSLGGTVTGDDMNSAIRLYGFECELEALIYATDTCITYTYCDPHPFLSVILAMEDFALEKVIEFYHEMIYLHREIFLGILPDDLTNFKWFGFFSLPYNRKVELLDLCCSSKLTNGHKISEIIKKAAEFPSLVELSRNKAHSVFRQVGGYKKPYQFHDAVKSLQLPQVITDVVRFKRPIYNINLV